MAKIKGKERILNAAREKQKITYKEGLAWWHSGQDHLPMQETRVRSLVWEDPTCCRAPKPMCHNY